MRRLKSMKAGIRRAAIEERVRDLLEMVGLADQTEKYPGQLSGGQQQRVALARALATSPGLLLLDEPLSALDAKVRMYLRKEIKDLQRRLGLTTIMVTHDQEEALTMADRIVVMNRGMIEQVGTPGEIYREPVNRFVADFIGQMNFLPGTVVCDTRVQLGQVQFRHRRTRQPMQPGATVTLGVRPEDVRIHNGPPMGENNAFAAEVADIDFIGNFFRARLAADCLDGMILAADLPSGVVRDCGLKPGHPLAVSLPEERIQVFPAG
jgi:iron(III) transport system ATP-binding protein